LITFLLLPQLRLSALSDTTGPTAKGVKGVFAAWQRAVALVVTNSDATTLTSTSSGGNEDAGNEEADAAVAEAQASSTFVLRKRAERNKRLDKEFAFLFDTARQLHKRTFHSALYVVGRW
jgi:hypothetical protein